MGFVFRLWRFDFRASGKRNIPVKDPIIYLAKHANQIQDSGPIMKTCDTDPGNLAGSIMLNVDPVHKMVVECARGVIIKLPFYYSHIGLGRVFVDIKKDPFKVYGNGDTNFSKFYSEGGDPYIYIIILGTQKNVTLEVKSFTDSELTLKKPIPDGAIDQNSMFTWKAA
jgi:hypothetical protein